MFTEDKLNRFLILPTKLLLLVFLHHKYNFIFKWQSLHKAEKSSIRFSIYVPEIFSAMIGEINSKNMSSDYSHPCLQKWSSSLPELEFFLIWEGSPYIITKAYILLLQHFIKHWKYELFTKMCSLYLKNIVNLSFYAKAGFILV